MTKAAFTTAPLALLLGLLGMKLGWKPNPDLPWHTALPLWTAAHAAYIIGNLAMFIVIAHLWSRTRNPISHTAAIAAVIGTTAMTGQMVIDLIVGFRANARSEMSAISRSIHDLPGFETFFYGVVPALGLAGTAILALVAAAKRQMPPWPAATFLVGSVLIGTGITTLMIIGGLTSCVALPAMVRPTPREAVSNATH